MCCIGRRSPASLSTRAHVASSGRQRNLSNPKCAQAAARSPMASSARVQVRPQRFVPNGSSHHCLRRTATWSLGSASAYVRSEETAQSRALAGAPTTRQRALESGVLTKRMRDIASLGQSPRHRLVFRFRAVWAFPLSARTAKAHLPRRVFTPESRSTASAAVLEEAQAHVRAETRLSSSQKLERRPPACKSRDAATTPS